MSSYEATFKVNYLDIGENNSLTLKGLTRMLLETACLHSDSVNYGLNDISKTHVAWLILNWKVHLYNAPRWNTKLKIKSWVYSFNKLHSVREFEVFDENNNVVAHASSDWILLNLLTHRISKISDEIASAYTQESRKLFDEDFFNEKSILDRFSFENPTYTYTIQRRDIDTNHHVDNLYYLDYAYEALPEEVFNNITFKTLDITYKKELKYGDSISCFYQKIENKHIVFVRDSENTKTHAIICLQ